MNNVLTKTEKAVFTSGVLLLCLSLCSHWALANYSGDKAIELYNAKAWLHGHPLYQGIFGVQPPLIYSLYTIPVWLSLHLGIIQDYHYLLLFGLAVVMYTIYTALRIIRRHPEFTHDTTKQAEFCLLLASVFITFQNPGYFFDREHILLVLTFPYALRFMPSLANVKIPLPESIIIGIMAAIGSCFKPQCMVVFAGVNLFYVLRERSFAITRTPENMAVYLLLTAYIALILGFMPEYFTVVIPMALATYSACNSNISELSFFLAALLPFTVTFVDFRLRYTSPYRKDIFYLVAVAGLFLLYALTNYGWGYSWNPLTSIVTIITGFVLWEYWYLKKQYGEKGLPVKPFVFGANACMACFIYNALFVLHYFSIGLNSCTIASPCEHRAQFIREVEIANNYQPVTSVESISVNFDPTWLDLNKLTGAQWETHYNLWMLAKFFLSDADFARRYKWITDYVGKTLADDMRTQKPQLVFVTDSDGFYGYKKNVDLVAFLDDASPEFAHEWENYRYVTKIDTLTDAENKKKHHGYFVYKRIN